MDIPVKNQIIVESCLNNINNLDINLKKHDIIENKKKIFCIGLHKTGTTSLHHHALNHKLKATHSLEWVSDYSLIENYDFFSDGGSHYDNIKEINFNELYNKYKNSFFIINIRDVKSWIISKLIHAGWNQDTKILPDKKKYNHNNWKHKSYLNIQLFIKHYYNRYIKILEFFIDKQDKSCIVDICNNKIDNLKTVFDSDNINYIKKTTVKKKKNIFLSDKIISFIDV